MKSVRECYRYKLSSVCQAKYLSKFCNIYQQQGRRSWRSGWWAWRASEWQAVKTQLWWSWEQTHTGWVKTGCERVEVTTEGPVAGRIDQVTRHERWQKRKIRVWVYKWKSPQYCGDPRIGDLCGFLMWDLHSVEEEIRESWAPDLEWPPSGKWWDKCENKILFENRYL